MTKAQLNTEIKKAKEIMDLLMMCVKDLTLSKAERNQYYKEYLEISTYYLQLNSK